MSFELIHPHEPARLELARLPTPVVELKQLATHAGVERILLKRDDLTGLEISGNKVRKLEYVVADALGARGRHVGHQWRVSIESLSRDRGDWGSAWLAGADDPAIGRS